jgi:formylglycine-generating enzyme required for sulfatase activity
VTQAQFRAVMGWNPSLFAGCPNCPVEGVNWYDAVEFCDRLTSRHLLEGKIPEGAKYRLPTEAEWEYACRAGTTSRFSFGDSLECVDYEGFCPSPDPYAWWNGNNSPTAHGTKPVRQKAPNPWGLYDMHGNVFEWCQDAGGPYPSGEVTDPHGPEGALIRLLRGGSWNDGLFQARSAARYEYRATARGVETFGFRVVLETP